MRLVRPAARGWWRRSHRCSAIGCRLCRPNRAGQRRNLANRARVTGSRTSGPDRPGEAREATDNGFLKTISTTSSRSWRPSPFSRKMHSIESGSTARTRSISKRWGHSQVTLRSWAVVAREEKPGGAVAGPQNGGVRPVDHGDEGTPHPLRPGPQLDQGSHRAQTDEPRKAVRVSEMESQRAKTTARSRPQRSHDRTDTPNPPGSARTASSPNSIRFAK